MYSYQQKIEEVHRRSKQKRENCRAAEWPQTRLRENSNEVRIHPEQMTCWRYGESGHRKKECWKALFCVNCGKQGHNSSRYRQMTKRSCTYCEGLDHTEEYCPLRRVNTLKQSVGQPPMLQRAVPSEKQPWNSQAMDWQFGYERHQKELGAGNTKGNKASAIKPEVWNKPQVVKGTPALFIWNVNTEEGGYHKQTGLQDNNMTSVSTGSNYSEISKAMEKISETNQLLAQQQMTQQRTLQALLYHQ